MSKIKVAVVGAGVGGSSVYRVLREIEHVQIIGVADRNLAAPGITLARKDKIYVTDNYEELVARPEIDVIIEATADPEVQRNIHKLKHAGAAVLEALAGNLLMVILQAKEELLEAKKLKSELWAILNSMQEAIEVANNTGLIKYVNPSFTRVTGIPESQRVGRNIFEVSPHGALAQSLVKQKAVVGYRSKVGGSGAEVIANAAPILVEGEMEGAVVVFQPITDILKLMDELQKSTTIIENLYAKIDQITGSKYTFDDLTGTSKVFVSTVEIAKRAAKSDFPVLLVGESGTGKELYAHAIHQASQRRGKAFIKISSASVPEELLESELFGHEKGSFTGAVKTKLGKVELSNGGTLFLDEIGEMNPYLQAKLVRLLREREFERVGGTETLSADVRLITATSMDLKSLVRKGRFREELYFLLNMIEVNLPPLRRRREDIPVLVDQFISKLNRKLGKMVRCVAPDALQLLSGYDWPGNVRELENVMERAMVAVGGDVILQQHLTPYIGQFNSIATSHNTEIMPLDKMEQMMLKAALARYGETLAGKKKAAHALNISLATLYNKLKKYRT